MNPAITTVLIRSSWALSVLTVLCAMGWVANDMGGDPWPAMVVVFALGGCVVALPGFLASLVALGLETPRSRGITAVVALVLAAVPVVTFVTLGELRGY